MFTFRGLTIDNKWVEGDLHHSESVKNGIKSYHSLVGYDFDFQEVIPESLGISFGLTDKNGTLIFASFPVNGVMSKGGDVVKYDRYFDHHFSVLFYGVNSKNSFIMECTTQSNHVVREMIFEKVAVVCKQWELNK